MPPSIPLSGRAVAPRNHVLNPTPTEYATIVVGIHTIRLGGLMGGGPTGTRDGARPTRGAEGRGSGALPSTRDPRHGATDRRAGRGRRRRSGSRRPVAEGSGTPAQRRDRHLRIGSLRSTGRRTVRRGAR